MNDAELKKTFPYGVTVIPRTEDDPSFPAAVGGTGDDETIFTVWPDGFHSILLSRDLKPIHDGFETKAAHESKTYFLRPLTKEQKVEV